MKNFPDLNKIDQNSFIKILFSNAIQFFIGNIGEKKLKFFQNSLYVTFMMQTILTWAAVFGSGMMLMLALIGGIYSLHAAWTIPFDRISRTDQNRILEFYWETLKFMGIAMLMGSGALLIIL